MIKKSVTILFKTMCMLHTRSDSNNQRGSQAFNAIMRSSDNTEAMMTDDTKGSINDNESHNKGGAATMELR
jgi:hypothetical protein